MAQEIATDVEDRFDPDPTRSYTLASRYYHDPDIYRRELEAIFYRAWNIVCHSEAVRTPGDFTTVTIGDQNIAVIRGTDGVLRAFYNVCQHRGHELLKGTGRIKVITCPYHAWSYHIDGRLRSARGSEKVEGFDKREFCLKPVQVEEFCTFVFVNLDPDAARLAEQSEGLADDIRGFAPDLDELTHAQRLTFDLKANWKTVIDNFLECYHCPVVHHAFVNLVDMDTYKIVNHGIYSTHHAVAGTKENQAYDVSGADVKVHAVWWLWPNTCFLRYPGSGNMMTMQMLPTGPEETHWIIDFYYLESEPDAVQREAINYVNAVLTPEDISITESVQRGLHSRGYNQGRYVIDKNGSGMSEHAVHHFHGLVLEAYRSVTGA